MNHPKAALALPIALVFILALLAFWLGEAGGIFPNPYGLAASLVLLLWIAYLVRASLAFLLLAGLVCCGAFVAGRSSDEHAFKECMEHGESLRQDLARYQRQHGHYPAQLKALGVALPGERLMHSDLMLYRPSAGGYTLSFKDMLVTYQATESQPFDAHK